MHSSLWFLDFHNLEERTGARYLPGFREVPGFSIFGDALFIILQFARPSHGRCIMSNSLLKKSLVELYGKINNGN
jgi:hypothetical protein